VAARNLIEILPRAVFRQDFVDADAPRARLRNRMARTLPDIEHPLNIFHFLNMRKWRGGDVSFPLALRERDTKA